MTNGLSEFADYLTETKGDLIDSATVSFDELTVTTEPSRLVDLVTFLRSDPQCQFVCYIDGCGVDWPERESRFDVVHHLLSPRQNMRIRVKVAVGDGETIPSVTSVFPGADWFEREAYDLYGILFSGHPDLRRILTDYGFEGHPLRKDFPVTGYVEVRYDDEAKRVVYEPVVLKQEYRDFDFVSPWEGTEYVLPGDEKKSG